MSTKQCPFCAETIQAQAVMCRFCNTDLRQPSARSRQVAPPPPRKPSFIRRFFKWLAIGTAVFIVLIIWIAARSGGDSNTVSDNPSAAPTFTPSPLPPTPAPAIGQDVIVEGIRWKILSAEKLGNEVIHENEFVDPLKTSGQFIKLRYEVENTASDPKSLGGVDIYDSQDRKFSRFSAISYTPDGEGCSLVNINPGIVQTCTEFYEVPADAVEMRVEVTDLNMFGSSNDFVGLGF